MEDYIQQLRQVSTTNPQTASDVIFFLEQTALPRGVFEMDGMPIPMDTLSPSWGLLSERIGQLEGEFIPQRQRTAYGKLMRKARRELFELIRNPPDFQVVGQGVRQLGDSYESVRGDGLKAMGCLCGGATKREQFYKTYKVPKRSYSIEELSAISKVPVEVLQQVYNRGIGAYKTNPQSVRLKHSFVKNVKAPMSAKLSKEQWAMSRIYSFLMGGEHDQDLRGGGPMSDLASSATAKFSLRQSIPRLTQRFNELQALGAEQIVAQGLTGELQALVTILQTSIQAKEGAKSIYKTALAQVQQEQIQDYKNKMKNLFRLSPEERQDLWNKPKILDPLPPVREVDDEGSGKKVKFARKHLRGMGIRATKGNVKKLLDAMDVEGVVFES